MLQSHLASSGIVLWSHHSHHFASLSTTFSKLQCLLCLPIPLRQPQTLFLVFKALPRHYPHTPPHSFSGLFFVIPLPSKQTLASAPEVGTHHTFILFLRLLHMHIPLRVVLSLFLLPGDSYSSIEPQLRRSVFWFKHRAPSVRWRFYGQKEM